MKTDGLTSQEIYDQSLDYIREMFRVTDETFCTGTMGSWLQEVEGILNRAKADLDARPMYQDDEL